MDAGQHGLLDLRPTCLSGGRWRDIAPGNNEHLYIYLCDCQTPCNMHGIRVKGCVWCCGVRARIARYGTFCPAHPFGGVFWIVDVDF